MSPITKVITRDGETRGQYLIRVAIAMLEENAYSINTVEYDEAECDASCLANDLKIEFGIVD